MLAYDKTADDIKVHQKLHAAGIRPRIAGGRAFGGKVGEAVRKAEEIADERLVVWLASGGQGFD